MDRWRIHKNNENKFRVVDVKRIGIGMWNWMWDTEIMG